MRHGCASAAAERRYWRSAALRSGARPLRSRRAPSPGRAARYFGALAYQRRARRLRPGRAPAAPRQKWSTYASSCCAPCRAAITSSSATSEHLADVTQGLPARSARVKRSTPALPCPRSSWRTPAGQRQRLLRIDAAFMPLRLLRDRASAYAHLLDPLALACTMIQRFAFAHGLPSRRLAGTAGMATAV